MQAPAHGCGSGGVGPTPPAAPTVEDTAEDGRDSAERPVRRYKQLQNWSTCQICHRCRPRGSVGWLDAPYRYPGEHKGPMWTGEQDPELRVIRCPEHWSDHALKISIGRTKKNRLLMAAVKEWAQESCKNLPHPYIEPFPLNDWPNPLPPEKRWTTENADTHLHPFQRDSELAWWVWAGGKDSPFLP